MSRAQLASRTLSVAIARPPDEVYDFVRDARNLPRWAYFSSVEADGDDWRATTAQGELRLRFAPTNEFGVLDHDVVLPDDSTVHVPMRVVANGDGSEVLFTLFRLPGTTDEAFDADAGQVARDLDALRHVLEDADDVDDAEGVSG